MPLDSDLELFNRSAPLLSKTLEQVAQMLTAKLQRGHSQLVQCAKGDEQLTEDGYSHVTSDFQHWSADCRSMSTSRMILT